MTLFISYRQKDTGWATLFIYSELCRSFSKHNIFRDIDSVPTGADFEELIVGTMGKCRICLAVIGPSWLPLSAHERSRPSGPGYYVNLEIKTALHQQIPVIPILIDGVSMPPASSLPPEISELSGRSAWHLDLANARTSMNDLLTQIKGELGRSSYTLSLDWSAFGSEGIHSEEIEFNEAMPVQVLLDRLYAGICEQVDAYTYGVQWVIQDKVSGTIFRDAGSYFAGRQGDWRTIGELGIRPKMRLHAIQFKA